MKLSFTLNSVDYIAEGSAQELSTVLSTLSAKPKTQTPAVVRSGKKQIKTSVFQKPVASNLTDEQRAYVASLFAYPPSKSPVGKPAFLLSIMLDGKPRTVKELTKLGSCTTACLRTVISRLQANNATVHISSKRLTESTIVQIVDTPQVTKSKAVRKKAEPKTINTTEFKNLAI